MTDFGPVDRTVSPIRTKYRTVRTFGRPKMPYEMAAEEPWKPTPGSRLRLETPGVIGPVTVAWGGDIPYL